MTFNAETLRRLSLGPEDSKLLLEAEGKGRRSG